ncbi:MAG: tetratricopeptide repeat protein [Pseudomonadota bacterium]
MASPVGQHAQSLGQIFERTVSLHRAGKLEEAEPLYRTYLARRPEHAQAWTNYGSLLRKTGRYEVAIAAHRRALELRPSDPSILNNLANALADDGHFTEAAGIRETLCDAQPEHPERLRDLCASLRGLGRQEEVIDRVTAAAESGWADGECLLQRALAKLMLGDYAGGFTDFENRYAGDEVRLPDNVPWPRWTGEPVAGKRILVLPEQGFGDAILMARFLPRLAEMGARTTLVVKPPLTRLFQEIEGLEAIVEGARSTDEFDYYTPNMSLPHLVGVPEDGPPPPPRLTIPEQARNRAARLVEPFRNRFRIGVVWTGSLTYKANHRRSCRPENFLRLAQLPGVQLFSLYKGDGREDFLASGTAGLIVDACGTDKDFAESAGLIAEMDLMITTDTAVVHVAASLGKPVWNMLSAEGFWLYGREGETTPWYPSMRLFRQDLQGDWTALFDRVEAALRTHLADRR